MAEDELFLMQQVRVRGGVEAVRREEPADSGRREGGGMKADRREDRFHDRGDRGGFE